MRRTAAAHQLQMPPHQAPADFIKSYMSVVSIALILLSCGSCRNRLQPRTDIGRRVAATLVEPERRVQHESAMAKGRLHRNRPTHGQRNTPEMRPFRFSEQTTFRLCQSIWEVGVSSFQFELRWALAFESNLRRVSAELAAGYGEGESSPTRRRKSAEGARKS